MVRTAGSTAVAAGADPQPETVALHSASTRRVFLHVVAETAQHAGHADILRESLDGQKTMG